jgi:glycosyltransferase involved in cell wall biosynthesis
MNPTHIHVHLFYGADPRQYRKNDNAGCLYGYHHAESEGLALSYSEDHAESRPLRFARRGLKALLGFDLIHTFRNRAALLEADVIWTHTEREYLSAALLLLCKGRKKSPLLLAQSVWLLDLWPSLSLPKRLFYKWLLGRADLLTTLSTVNAALARKYWGREATPLLYGISTDDFPVTPLPAWQPHSPLRIAAIGNDRDRDWQTLLAAFANDAGYTVRLATRRQVWRRTAPENFTIAAVHGLPAQRALYDWADIIVVPLHPNYHASGITVILEAVATGKPVVATAGGGLEDYFSERSVWYVPPHDARALHDCVALLSAQPGLALEKSRHAQQEFACRDLTTQAFARQHVALTHELLQGAGRGVDLLPQSRI